jgi:hypothetical protein
VTRVYVVVEGKTEKSFVLDVLAPRLHPNVYLIPIVLGPPGRRGGDPRYPRVKRHVTDLLKQEQAVFCTTMLDFYGLGAGFPGMPLPAGLGSREKVERIERAMSEDFAAEVPDRRPDIRFLPYLQLHEYEGLLFSDPAAFAAGIGRADLALRFFEIRRERQTPEDINDNPNTAPSKRVLALHEGYSKVDDGLAAAKAVGIDRMRQECPHFREWLERLEALATL